MIQKLIHTDEKWSHLVARLTLGLVLFPHGAQKMLGLFGGYGFNATLDSLTTHMGLPWLIALLVILIEFFGAISLLIGFASRFWSVAIIGLFIGIIFTAQIQNGFFMNWFGNQNGEGIEYSLLVIGLVITILINGSGKYSVDNQLIQKLNK